MTGAPPLHPRAALRRRRCARHEEREAVARCSTCQGYFCRECIGEHDGKLYCARCIKITDTKAPAPKRPARLKRAVAVLLAIAAAWLAFYMVGRILLRIPPEMHEGTLWKALTSGPDE